MEQLQEHWPAVAARDDLRAFQIVEVGRKYGLRINTDVRGTLALRIAPAFAKPHAPTLEIQYEPAPEDNAAGTYFALLRAR
jgi:hypothetical protein